MNHSTQLRHHVRDKHFWLDFSLVLILWSLLFFLPTEFFVNLGPYFRPILKLVAVISTLELVTFFIFHLVQKEQGFILQGFLGGVISSTAFFVHVCRSTDSTGHAIHYTLALVAALLAMLIECVVIILSLVPSHQYYFVIPLLVQILIFLLLLVFFRTKSKNEAVSAIDLPIVDDPVVWKKVIKLTIFIGLLTFTIRILPAKLNLNPALTIFVTSLFEAHSVLAASLISGVPESSLYFSILLILSGHTLSKCMIIWRAKNKQVSPKVMILLFGTLFCSWLSYWLQLSVQ